MPEMNCTVCRRPKNKLKRRASRIYPQMVVYICETCEALGWEPRAAIILACRQYGPKVVKPYLDGHKYHGEAILAKEIAI